MTAPTTTALTIPGLVSDAARLWPDDLATIDGELHMTFAELEEAMLDTAAAFIAAGLQPGQRVGLRMDMEFSPQARIEPPIVALPAIFDRVLAVHGSYELDPLEHGQRHAVYFTSRPR